METGASEESEFPSNTTPQQPGDIASVAATDGDLSSESHIPDNLTFQRPGENAVEGTVFLISASNSFWLKRTDWV